MVTDPLIHFNRCSQMLTYSSLSDFWMGKPLPLRLGSVLVEGYVQACTLP